MKLAIPDSVTRLMESAGLDPLKVEFDHVWGRWKIRRSSDYTAILDELARFRDLRESPEFLEYELKGMLAPLRNLAPHWEWETEQEEAREETAVRLHLEYCRHVDSIIDERRLAELDGSFDPCD